MSNRTAQLVTYLGNKRKLCPALESALGEIIHGLGQDRVTIAEPFSGSGVVSRLLRSYASTLFVNDIAPFAEEVAKCYLQPTTDQERAAVQHHMDRANAFADTATPGTVPRWVSTHWTCEDENNVQPHERLYYTPQNALRIDSYRHYIDTECPAHIRPRLMGPLLYECSVHTNTNGNFSGFYRSQTGPPWGGDRHIDERRITTPIRLQPPPFVDHDGTVVHITRTDAIEALTAVPEVDIVYIDPPYNKHPYATYYFMLDLITTWDTTRTVPDTTRGQDAEWIRSPFNSYAKAKDAMSALIHAANAKVIMLSYNNRGIIEEADMRAILEERGRVTLIPLVHNTYNKMQGIAAKKRSKPDVKTVEHLWIVECQ